MSGTQVQPPYGVFYAGRGFRIVRQIEEKLSSAGWAAKDISGSRYTYRVRAFDELADSLVYDKPVDKSATESDDGWLDYYFPLGADAHDVLRWEMVEVDNSNPDSSTPTTKCEEVLEFWFQDVKAKPPTS